MAFWEPCKIETHFNSGKPVIFRKSVQPKMSKCHYFFPGLPHVFRVHMLVHSADKPIPVATHVLVLSTALHIIQVACMRMRPRIKAAHTDTCADHVFTCLKQFSLRSSGPFDVDVKLASHPSPHLSVTSCCSLFLSIHLPFFLSSFLPLFPSLTPTLSQQVIH